MSKKLQSQQQPSTISINNCKFHPKSQTLQDQLATMIRDNNIALAGIIQRNTFLKNHKLAKRTVKRTRRVLSSVAKVIGVTEVE